MKSIALFWFLAPVFLTSGLFAADPIAPTADPEATARVFYTELRRHGVSGLPAGEAWAALAPFLSETLVAGIERARGEQAEAMKKFPDEKPPWIEGDLFSSLFEGPRQFKIGPAKITGEKAEVPVDCLHTEGGDTAKWTDTLLLIKTPRGWRLDNVRYGATWEFGNMGTLQEALAPIEE